MGTEPWPADWNAPTDRFPSTVDSLFAGKNDGLLALGCVAKNMSTVKCDARCGILIADLNDWEIWQAVINADVWAEGKFLELGDGLHGCDTR